ncbi:hypothetical protein J4210_02985 [Candidatus Woesearchaeota archaeon]|nr:hypothetical protein [Candidatus Woesearchaeota archaeon]
MADWQECLKKRIVKEIQEDKGLIISLLKSSKNKQDSQQQLHLSEITSGSKISLAYDALRELLEALALQQGFKIYNHECYTAFLKEVLNKSDWGDEFDQIRKVRNSINYYGQEISPEEAKGIIREIERLQLRINSLLR